MRIYSVVIPVSWEGEVSSKRTVPFSSEIAVSELAISVLFKGRRYYCNIEPQMERFLGLARTGDNEYPKDGKSNVLQFQDKSLLLYRSNRIGTL
jgi:hypothetical protein